MFEFSEKIILFGDFHLNLNDERLKYVERFFKDIVANYKNLIILGDFFEFYYSFPEVVPAGYLEILKILKEFSEKLKIFYIEGNHDFGLKNFFNILTFEEKVEFKVNNKKFIAIHGDTIDNNDRKYKILRKILRTPFIKLLMDNLPPYIVLKISKILSDSSKNYLRKPKSANFHEQIKNIFNNSEIIQKEFDILISAHFHCNVEFKIENKEIIVVNGFENEKTINYLEINENGEILRKKWNF